MPAGEREAGLVLDRPQGVGLGDRAQRLERLGDDAVDQRIDPEALLPGPPARLFRRLPALEHVEHDSAQDLAVGWRQFAREKRDRRGAGAPAGEQKFRQLGGKRSGRRALRPVGRIGLVAAVGGVGDSAARGEEEALEFVPLGRRVDARADAFDLDALVHDRAVAEAFDQNRIGPGAREGRDPPAAFRASGGPSHRDWPMASPRGKASLTNRSTWA